MDKVVSFDDHYSELSNLSGQSVEVVKSVLRAETESAIRRLRKNQKVSLPGRCKFVPSVKYGLGVECKTIQSITAKAYTATKILDELSGISEFDADIDEDNDDASILSRVVSIESLDAFS